MSAKYEVGLHGDYDEGDMLMSLHNASLSEDAVKSATARMLKELMPVAIRTATKESQQITDNEAMLNLLFAVIATARNVFTNMALNIAPAEALVIVHDDLIEHFTAGLEFDRQEIAKRFANGDFK